MARVTFHYLFLHRRGDGLDDWRRYLVADAEPTLDVDAKREQYAAGNTGVVRTPQRSRDLPYRLVDVPRADVAEGGWLEAGIGEVHLIRDPRGRMHWGFWNQLAPVELPGEQVATVDLPLTVYVVTAPDLIEAGEA